MNRNACRIPELEVMDEDRHIEEVLDKFVNCHEQTYEEFLSTFTHLSKDNVTQRGAFGTNSSESNFPSVKFTQRNEPNDHHLSNKAIFLRTSSQCSEEEQIVMDEGQKVGSSFQGDLNRAGKVKVDNFLDLEDLDLDEEIKPQMNLLLLPGEVEQDRSMSVPSYIPSVAQPLTSGVKPRPTGKGGGEQREEFHTVGYYGRKVYGDRGEGRGVRRWWVGPYLGERTNLVTGVSPRQRVWKFNIQALVCLRC
nr:protein C11orf74 homolog isoform X1 [Globicephala melas]XP_030720514.1 protein C11orf74 homolog isoform X1 [Globicephala melas]XP_030720515.1 protein C11orf74 homolog isoform X1 [Globicephala melas]XP_030720516.1 protein C11orf74 homolog isoform X1 [Globicephala melas]XP_030720517.1 protein C11orf74 homolog isoform X1 [Globicephala melas]XP_030720518.1 protein C11orf74 homolog isoform X1 [Globicephala melas]